MENQVLQVLLQSISSFVVLFIFAKLMGKKQIAELSFIDYVIGISIGSIAAEWCVDFDTQWYHYLIALTVFFLLSMIVTYSSRTLPFVKKLLEGEPVVIIGDGKINYRNIRRSKLSVNDVLGMCRDKNYFDLSDIAYAIFETSGSMSILPKGEQRPVVAKDMNVDTVPSTLPAHIVIDGNVNEEDLKKLGYDDEWLYNKLGIKRKKDLSNILLATYNAEADSFCVHQKVVSPAPHLK